MAENNASGTQGTENVDTTGNENQGAEGQQGVETQAPNFGGFETQEALIADHNRLKGEVDDLSGVKGRQGQEIGDLRQKLVAQEAFSEGLQTAQTNQPAQPAGTTPVTRSDINRQFGAGEITQDQANDMKETIVKEEMRSEFQEIIQESDTKRETQTYADRFIAAHEDYTELYNSGALQPYMNNGASAEEAYFQHTGNTKVDVLAEENKTLKEQLAAKQTTERSDGVQEGVKIAQGSEAAGKVLGGSQGGESYAQSGNQPIAAPTHNDRVNAALNHPAIKGLV